MIYRHTSRTNVHNIRHTVQSYSFQVPQHADTVELKHRLKKEECTQVFSSSSLLSSLIPENREIMFDIWSNVMMFVILI